MLAENNVDRIISMALEEDIGTGDITTLSTIPQSQQINGKLIAKEAGIICGMEIIKKVFKTIDTAIEVIPYVQDGGKVHKGDIIAEINGPAIGILMGERVALNFMQHLSGISTKTARMVEEVQHTGVKIIDTRKTTPGMRVLEKYAVKMGGGANHRFNLSDGVLIKDNHIKAAAGITNAISAARKNAPHTLKVEVEVENMEQITEALEAGADIIMLDNMDIEEMKEAVAYINGRALVEASGNMGDSNLRAVAETGVNFISIGALTHTVRALDISLKFI